MSKSIRSILFSLVAKAPQSVPALDSQAHSCDRVEICVERNRSPSSSPKGSVPIDANVLISGEKFGSHEDFLELNASLSSAIKRVEKISNSDASGVIFESIMDDIDSRISSLYEQYESLLQLTLFDGDGYFLRVTDCAVISSL